MSDPQARFFRPTPQAGEHVWRAEALAPGDWMLALGAEAAAEIAAALAGTGGLTSLAAVLRDLGLRLDHGRGFALLRGLPAGLAPDAALLTLMGAALGRALGPAQPMLEAPGPADAWLLLAGGAGEVTLASAAAAHNAVMAQDRAALASLFSGEPPGFSAQGGVFAGRRVASEALDAALEQPGGALRLPLRAGDVLALNPSLVWCLGPIPAALTGLALATEPSRLGLPVWAATTAR